MSLLQFLNNGYFAGKVGIGTNSPSSQLAVASTGANPYSATLDSTSNMKGIRNVVTSNTDDMVGIYFATGTTTTGTHWSGITGSRTDNATDWGTQLNFYTHDNSVAGLNLATQKMVIKGDGNVGIGTTSPGVKLTVVTPNVVNTAVNVLKLGDDTNGLVFKSYFDATGIAWRLNKGLAGINMVTLSQGGNVGIGTTSPSEKLDVRDGTITSRDSGNVNYAELDRFAGLTLKGNGAGAKYISTPNTDDLGFKTNNAEKMRITSSGNVGIGTTSPGFKLDVNSSSFVGARIESTSSGYAPASILLESGHADSRGQGIYQYNSVSKNSWFSGVPYSTTSDDWVIAHKLETTAFNSDVAQMSNALFCVNDNGNVGIGTTTPKAKLDINGHFCVDSKSHTVTNAFTTCLTINLSSHTGCHVIITAFGDWPNHSSAAYRGEFFVQNGADGYKEPGIILRQDDNSNDTSDQIICQIVDPTSTANPKDFQIQIRHTDPTSPVNWTAQLTYTVQGKFNSIT